jgi:O-antigen/teichoic acid export membrane protein
VLGNKTDGNERKSVPNSRASLLSTVRRNPVFNPLRGRGLKARALKGSIWTIGGFGAQKVFALASNLILARLLFPDAFGLMALVNVVIVGLAMFSDVGIKPAIIQDKRGEDPAFLNTAWTIQIIRGFVLWAAACIIAWPASLFYGEPILFPLICVVGVAAAINGFQTTALATSNRNIRLARLTLVQLGGQVISISVMVTLAWMFGSVWALATGNVVGAIVSTTLGHVFLPSHGHAVRLEKEALYSLVRFGRWIFWATLVTFLGGHGIVAVRGALVPAGTLGIISIAGSFPWAVSELTNRLVGSIGFPALSSIAREEPERMRSVLDRIRLRLLALTLPAFVALSLASTLLIDTLYDKRYAAAGTYLAILAITHAIGVVPIFYQNAFLACGNSRAHFVISSAFMALRVAGVIVGFYIAGVVGMLVGAGIATFVGFFIAAHFARQAGWLSVGVDLLSIGFIALGAILSFVWHSRIV